MATPYVNISLADLTLIKGNLLKILEGKQFSSQNVPGLSYARRVDSLADVRSELTLVQEAIDDYDPTTARVDRTYMQAT